MTPKVKNLALDYPFFETYFLYLFSELGTRITICINPSTVSLTRRQKPTRNVVLGNIFKWLAVGRHNTKYVVNCRHFMRLRVLFVTPYHISRLLPPNSHLLSLVSYLPPLVSLSCLPQPLPSLVSCLSSPSVVSPSPVSCHPPPFSLQMSHFSPLITPPPLFTHLPLKHQKRGGGVNWTDTRRVEDDHRVRRGEVGRQQGWRMTAWAGRGGRWLLGGEGGIWLPAGVKNDRWAGRGRRWPLGGEGWIWPTSGVEDDSWTLDREGWEMTTGWGWVNFTASRLEDDPGGEGWIIWPPSGVEDDHWARRGEFDC